MSTSHYSTFLIRHWHLPDQRDRIEIQHIQSGSVAHLDSLGAIPEWMLASSEQQHNALPERRSSEKSARAQDPGRDG